MQITLLRTLSTDTATRGVMSIGGAEFQSIEQPWRDNLEGHSCVPLGTYELVEYQSPKHGRTWQLHNPALNVYSTSRGPVPVGARSLCEIHSANWGRQLEGCIAIGLEGAPMMDPVTGCVEPAVEHSLDAVAQLRQLIPPGTDNTLTISSDTSEP